MNISNLRLNSLVIDFSKQIICVMALLNCAAIVFTESEEDFKKRILANANLAGQSAAEIMAEDDENDEALAQGKKRKLAELQREVPYSDDQIAFIDAYYNHKILTDDDRENLYTNSILAAYQMADEYEKYVGLSRAEYYKGISLLEKWDPTSLNSIDLTDAETAESVNVQAGAAFDKAIEYAENAIKIKNGSDAYTILSHSISANCAAKNTAYILGNGLKVRSYAKKAVKLDYANGTAHFLVIAQDIYAPMPFAKFRSGRKKMIATLNDKYILTDNQDKLLICTAVGYSFYQQKKWNKSIEWYKKALEVYPGNYSSHQMIEKIRNIQNKKK